jgi:hypothetical protein
MSVAMVLPSQRATLVSVSGTFLKGPATLARTKDQSGMENLVPCVIQIVGLATPGQVSVQSVPLVKFIKATALHASTATLTAKGVIIRLEFAWSANLPSFKLAMKTNPAKLAVIIVQTVQWKVVHSANLGFTLKIRTLTVVNVVKIA